MTTRRGFLKGAAATLAALVAGVKPKLETMEPEPEQNTIVPHIGANANISLCTLGHFELYEQISAISSPNRFKLVYIDSCGQACEFIGKAHLTQIEKRERLPDPYFSDSFDIFIDLTTDGPITYAVRSDDGTT